MFINKTVINGKSYQSILNVSVQPTTYMLVGVSDKCVLTELFMCVRLGVYDCDIPLTLSFKLE